MQVFAQFFATILFQLTQVTGNLGVSIILFTVVLRLLLTPISIIGLRVNKKTQEIQPELSALQKKYKKDPKKLQAEQAALYKKYGVNPLAGCIPQILQIGLLIVLYRAFVDFFNNPLVANANTSFLWLNLSQPDPYYILPLLAVVTQFLLSLMSIPAPKPGDNKQPKKAKAAGKEGGDMSSTLTSSLQTQMVFLFPLLTGFISLKLPAGLVLYWVVSTVVSMVQQYFVGGWGKLGWYVLKGKQKVLTAKS